MPSSTSEKRCRWLPHGPYSMLVACLASIAWLASLFQDGCDYSKVTGPIVDELASVAGIPWLEFGLGAYREPKGQLDESGNLVFVTSFTSDCHLYPDSVFDTAWTTARSFAFLALVLGGGGTLFVWCSTCFVFSRGTWKWTGYGLSLGSLCQAVSFVWFTTQVCTWNTCEIFWGSKADIVATVMWTVSATCMMAYYPSPISVDTTALPQDEHHDDPETDHPPPSSSKDFEDEEDLFASKPSAEYA